MNKNLLFSILFLFAASSKAAKTAKIDCSLNDVKLISTVVLENARGTEVSSSVTIGSETSSTQMTIIDLKVLKPGDFYSNATLVSLDAAVETEKLIVNLGFKVFSDGRIEFLKNEFGFLGDAVGLCLVTLE